MGLVKASCILPVAASSQRRKCIQCVQCAAVRQQRTPALVRTSCLRPDPQHIVATALCPPRRAARRSLRQLHLINMTLVLPPDQYAYTTFWLTFLLSVVPEARQKAAWLQIYDLRVGLGLLHADACVGPCTACPRHAHGRVYGTD